MDEVSIDKDDKDELEDQDGNGNDICKEPL